MSAQDEVAQTIADAANPRVEAAAAAMWEQRPMMRTSDGSPRPWDEVPAWSYGARYRAQAKTALAAADAVDARKPRTITTAEELDALPRGAVVACISHILNLPVTFVFQRGSHNAMGYGWSTPDTPGQIESADVFEFVALNGYPTTFTVLVEPDFGATR